MYGISSSSSLGVCASIPASGEAANGAITVKIRESPISATMQTENTPEASLICRLPSITEIVTAQPTPIAKPIICIKYSTGRLSEIAVIPSMSIKLLTSMLSTMFPSCEAIIISTPGTT